MKKGLSVRVLRDGLGDCTNGGVTSIHNDFILVGEGVPEVAGGESSNKLVLCSKRVSSDRILTYAVPLSLYDVEKNCSLAVMMGGNFIYSFDSRFRKLTQEGSPIPVHDRVETWEQYCQLSS